MPINSQTPAVGEGSLPVVGPSGTPLDSHQAPLQSRTPWYRREPVKYYKDGKDAWRAGLGFLLRLRWVFGFLGLVAVSVVANLITATAPPTWWHWVWVNGAPHWPILRARITMKEVAPAFVIVILVGLWAFLVLWRRVALRSNAASTNLHSLAHFLRDNQSTLCSLLSGDQEGPGAAWLELFGNQLCDHVQNYFCNATGDKTVHAAIRLAYLPSTATDQADMLWPTIGRSSGLNPNRKLTSESLPSDRGVVSFFSRKDHNRIGIFVYYNLARAAKQGAYMITKNDRIFRRDIRTQMVAPLNAWSNDTQCMIGLLYVTSARRFTFGPRYVDILRAIADSTATALSHSASCLKLSSALPMETIGADE